MCEKKTQKLTEELNITCTIVGQLKITESNKAEEIQRFLKYELHNIFNKMHNTSLNLI